MDSHSKQNELPWLKDMFRPASNETSYADMFRRTTGKGLDNINLAKYKVWEEFTQGIFHASYKHSRTPYNKDFKIPTHRLVHGHCQTVFHTFIQSNHITKAKREK